MILRKKNEDIYVLLVFGLVKGVGKYLGEKVKISIDNMINYF